jgi:hypothetical protein
MLIYVCPGNNDIFCGGEVEPLNKPVFIPQFGLIESADGRVCKTCGLVMPKANLKPKRVWSRLVVWAPYFKRVEKVEELLKPQPEPKVVERIQVQEQKGEVQMTMAKEKKEPMPKIPPKQFIEFLKTPVFSRRKIEINGKALVFDYTGPEALITVNGVQIWKGIGATIRNHSNPQKLLIALTGNPKG